MNRDKKNKRIFRYTLLLLLIICAACLAACSNSKTAAAIESSQVIAEAQTITDSQTLEVSDIVETAEPAQSSGRTETAAAAAETTAEEAMTSVTEPPPASVSQTKEITLMAVGDNLMHLGIVKTGLQSDGTYDFSFLFEGIEDFLDVADIKIINQETILGGNEYGPSGFPNFNSPTEVGDAIAAAGFNVVLHASNHSADMGIKGIQNCEAFWETHPAVLMTGIHSEKTEIHEIPILTIEGIDFAILNYTYSPNMETLPASIRGHLDMLCSWDENNGRIDFTAIHPDVLEDIARAEEMADVVIVCPHWGTEYTPEPSGYQRQFAKQMTQAGADLIIGTHPHVVQPMEWVESENGNYSLCYYSLGNYVSTQKNGLSMLEAMAWVTFQIKEDKVQISMMNSGMIPLVCHYTSGPVRLEQVYLLEEYTQEQAERHGIRGYGGVDLDLEELQGWADDIFGIWRYPAKKALQAE